MNQFIGPRRQLVIKSVRPMVRTDLIALAEPSSHKTPRLQKLREAHHHFARLMASGLKITEIARELGFSYSRASTLASSPAILEQVARYREMADEAWRESRDEVYESIHSAKAKAWRMINDTLDEADETNEPIPLPRLLAIASDASDRSGHHKRSATLNVNIDFAANLERAIARTRNLRPLEE